MGIRSTITGKNQITIPAAIVRELQLEPGMQVEFQLGENRVILMRRAETRAELARQIQGKWRSLLQPGDDPIGELIREREEEDKEHA